jgi:hypothetical protein
MQRPGSGEMVGMPGLPSRQDGGKHIFAWLRRDEIPWAPSPRSKQRQLDEADAAWWQLWGKAPLTAEQIRCGVQLVQEDARMPQLAPLTGGQLRRAALSMGKRKAPGADGLQAADWVCWPKLHWDRLARMVQLCEEQVRWPQHLRIAHVMLLSKGGMPADKL